MIHCMVNGVSIEAAEGSTILDVVDQLDVSIPTLCHMDLDPFCFENKPSSCRLCMVEVKGRPKLCTACSEEVTEGMEVWTNSMRAVSSRRMNLELLLSDHPKDCLTCPKNLDCELQSLAREMGITHMEYPGEKKQHASDASSCAIFRNPNKCVMCRRCEAMCNEVQTVGALSGLDRGFDAVVGTAFKMPLNETSCTFCGQCVAVCPTAALVEADATTEVWQAIRNPSKHVVVQVAPAIRVSIGELFGMKPGQDVTGELVTALRTMGFDTVFDTDFSADLTIMEEASELIHRLQTGKNLPIITSCCPAWIRFIEANFPDMLELPSTCRSPQIMMGSVVKMYYAERMHINPKDIVMVSIMPCTAKKEEARRSELSNNGMQNVDIVLSTRELGRMIKWFGMDFPNLPESTFDSIMGESTGAGAIFGTTGGVMEAALRTAAEWVGGESLEELEFHDLRGVEGIREADIQIADRKLHIGIVHGLGNARKLMEGIRKHELHFDAVEVMACPGGCIGGGGQPYHHGKSEILLARQRAMYEVDRSKPIRKSHENPMIQEIYSHYLGNPCGNKAHKLLHTTFEERELI